MQGVVCKKCEQPHTANLCGCRRWQCQESGEEATDDERETVFPTFFAMRGLLVKAEITDSAREDRNCSIAALWVIRHKG